MFFRASFHAIQYNPLTSVTLSLSSVFRPPVSHFEPFERIAMEESCRCAFPSSFQLTWSFSSIHRVMDYRLKCRVLDGSWRAKCNPCAVLLAISTSLHRGQYRAYHFHCCLLRVGRPYQPSESASEAISLLHAFQIHWHSLNEDLL